MRHRWSVLGVCVPLCIEDYIFSMQDLLKKGLCAAADLHCPTKAIKVLSCTVGFNVGWRACLWNFRMHVHTNWYRLICEAVFFQGEYPDEQLVYIWSKIFLFSKTRMYNFVDYKKWSRAELLPEYVSGEIKNNSPRQHLFNSLVPSHCWC